MRRSMWNSVCRVYIVAVLLVVALLGGADPANAQYKPPAPAVIGEDYHVEATYGWWNAEPSLLINSEALGIIGSDIDLTTDLGIEQKQIGVFDLALRPAKKHRFRFGYLPISYSADTVVRRTFVFNGQQYNIGLPVQTTADFKTYRFGYEYDFAYFKRGFAGVLVDLKYTNVDVRLLSPIGLEYTSAVAPIPTIGFVGRAYVAQRVAVGGEISFFRVPSKLSDRYDARYTDIDLYTTVNINKHVGAQTGYRSINAHYDLDSDNGTLKFKGLYLNGVVRF